jgi:hypothetical protein
MADVSGLDQVMANIRTALGDRLRPALAAAVYQEGEAVLTLAKEKCPVDTGRLRATGYVAPPVQDGDRLSCETGFGTDYAIYVHENLAAAHPVGEAKFLEKALLERSSGFLERLARRAQLNASAGVSVEPLSAGA